MIYQYTGQPGHGKTLHAIERLLEFKDQGREVYACNIREFDYQKTGVKEFTPEQFRDWHNLLPDGAVLLVDECYEHEMLPKLGPGVALPEHIKQLAKHRHRGIDFIFVCQSPSKQMHPFVHDLIESHTHVRRRFGLNFVHLRIFDRYESRPQKAHPLMLKRTRLPKRPMGTYKSTELDTTERKVPWYYYAGAVIVVLIIGGIVFTTLGMKKQFDPNRKVELMPGSNGATATVRPGVGSTAERSLGTAVDYAKLHVPRFPGMPWTAPAYDERSVTADPQLYCLSSMPAPEDPRPPSCTCLTEQGTEYEIEQAYCRRLAIKGPVYNPYKQQRASESHAQPRDLAPLGETGHAQAEPAVAAMTAPQIARYGDMGIGPKGGQQ